MKNTSIFALSTLLLGLACTSMVLMTGCDRPQESESVEVSEHEAGPIAPAEKSSPPPSVITPSSGETTVPFPSEEGFTMVFSQPDFEIVVIEDEHKQPQLMHRDQLAGSQKLAPEAQ